MIATQKELSDRASIARQKAAKLRQEHVLALYIAGMTVTDIAKRLEVTRRTIYHDLAEVEDTRVRVEGIIEDAGIDPHDVWITLSKMHDADLAELFDADNELLPVAKWPRIWRQGLAGEIAVETDAEGGKKFKVKRESLLKTLELAGKLKQVDAFVKAQVDAPRDVTLTVVYKGGSQEPRIINLLPEATE